MHLDLASNGHFMGKDVDEGLILGGEVALSDGKYPEEYDRSDRGSSVKMKHKKELKTLNDKLDKILTGQQKQVHFVCEDDVNQEEEDPQTEEVCYMSNQGGYNKGYQHKQQHEPLLSQHQVENPQDQVYPPQQNQNQGGQQTVYFKRATYQRTSSGATELNTKLAEINNKVDCSYNDLNKKLESLNSKVQHLEAKSHNIPSSSKVLPERVGPTRSNEDIAIQEEEESVDIEAEDSVEKESVEPEPVKQRGAQQSHQKQQEEEGKLFLFLHLSNQFAFSNKVQEANGRKMQESL
ncbi:unnamed protein product [Microthlaspi erraticum]|uniref:Uncharacterized protein n=1 Tax=Microthlaspi erraticum TaxID=1685480 RepID=A0A6D2KGW6_9BRAS|nr:unnamed protein product [Microthlaspi erraticum]